MELATAQPILMAIFVIGYLFIVLEYALKINKTAISLLMAALMWSCLFLIRGHGYPTDLSIFCEHFSHISEIVFFLLAAMTIVELIESHQGFQVVTDWIQTNSKKKMLWLIGIITFVLSAILDNLTTTIMMVALLRKLIPEKEERMIFGSMVVIAANVGGAWTPIGDVTTTMLWINGNVSTLPLMRDLFLPSVFSLLLTLVMFSSRLKGYYPQRTLSASASTPGKKILFFSGLGAFIFVPIFKALTGLPPFMGIILGLGILWIITDLIHGHDATRHHLRVPFIFTKVDLSSVLFFLGILLCIQTFATLGLLSELARFLERTVGSLSVIATLVGLVSAVIDNVPLVAAGMQMYDLQTYPINSFFWMLLAFCAGTGGSILIIGSAAGIALMGMEKVNFFWYVRHVSWIALVSYLGGIGVYLLQYSF